MRKIVLVNQKGGCGKTTTAINLASCLANGGKKVLLVDLDPQGHLGMGLGLTVAPTEKSIYEVLLGETGINDVIHSLNKNLDIICSNVVLSAFEQVMAGAPEREYKLAQSLTALAGNYDYLIMDSPPSVGLLTFNGLMAADEVLIPVDPSSFSIDGLERLLETIQMIAEKAGHALRFKIIATNIDLRTNFCRTVLKKLEAGFPKNFHRTFINSCTRLREAASLGKSIVDYDRRCSAFHDYQQVSKAILKEAAGRKTKGHAAKAFRAAAALPAASPENGILFKFEAPENALVQIAGDFNNWEPEDLCLVKQMDKPLWQKVISLRPGSYQYKYLVDGNWMTDPANAETVDDFFGSVNSIIKV